MYIVVNRLFIAIISNMHIVDGDIVHFATPFSFIAHQCNCWSKTPKHLSRHIFNTYPEANIYQDGTNRVPGEIIIRNRVINMLSQCSVGRAGRFGPDETYEKRRMWLRQCLKKILDNKAIKVVYFPFGIACGAAGDSWKAVSKILEEFDLEMRKQNRKAFLVHYSG